VLHSLKGVPTNLQSLKTMSLNVVSPSLTELKLQSVNSHSRNEIPDKKVLLKLQFEKVQLSYSPLGRLLIV